MDREMHLSQMALYTGQPLKPLFSPKNKTVLLIPLLSAPQFS